ncbi:MAG: hypothetical protein ACP5N6_09490 [Anaerolineae bacterium]|uniref:hypothetical protein n=1 Tax=Thermogutta sp. TaxID=1962930 RepID=UPI00322091D3
MIEATLAIGLVAILASAGIGLLVYNLLNAGVELLGRATVSRARRALETIMRRPGVLEQATLEKIAGVPSNLDLAPWTLVCALAGLVITMSLIPDGPARVMGILGGVLPPVWRRRKLSLLRQQIRKEVADLLENIRLQLAFGGSLAFALATLDDAGNGVVYRRLQDHREILSLQGPEAVLERLAGELDSPDLRMLVARLGMARHGRTSYEQVLADAVTEAVREHRRTVEIEVEGAPLRLMIPMLFLLFPPVLVMLLYPPAYALINQLAGAGSYALP